jgi:thiamine pyrophosphokinase
MLGEGNIAEVAKPGTSEIEVAPGYGKIGVLPFVPAVITSSGLKWDMAEAQLTFGGLISTSNEAVGDRFTITSDKPVVVIQGKDKEAI